MSRTGRAVIVLPEIFGVTHFVEETVRRVIAAHGVPCAALDFALPITGAPRIFSYDQVEEARSVVNQVTSDMLLAGLETVINSLQTENPSVTEFSVMGFCYGGTLAYLTGLDPRVTRIVSYYGTRARESVERLAHARAGTDLRVLSLFGGLDTSIPEEEREHIKNVLAGASIQYEEVVYQDAGHAFMNFDRPDRYHAPSADDSTLRVNAFLSNSG